MGVLPHTQSQGCFSSDSSCPVPGPGLILLDTATCTSCPLWPAIVLQVFNCAIHHSALPGILAREKSPHLKLLPTDKHYRTTEVQIKTLQNILQDCQGSIPGLAMCFDLNASNFNIFHKTAAFACL